MKTETADLTLLFLEKAKLYPKGQKDYDPVDMVNLEMQINNLIDQNTELWRMLYDVFNIPGIKDHPKYNLWKKLIRPYENY